MAATPDPTPSPAPVRLCPGCERPAAASTPEGLCAACLLGRALALADAVDPEEAEASPRLATRGLVGRSIGGYEILATHAEGAMGIVFRARQKKPRRTVALKVISAGELATRRMVERFHNEALAAARLNHPHIVPIYEVGEEAGWHFFSMEFVEGQTLADLIRQQRPGPVAAAALLVKIARATEHAHQRGILHRDLKPTNILIDPTGEPRLTDFGLAKVTESESELTLTHAVLGTPAYMSPEQAAGHSRDITTATDVYGLGAVLYELLTGHPPFVAPSTTALLRKIAEEEPTPPRWENSGRSSETHSSNSSPERSVSALADLSVITLKCLEKDPTRRYATAGELADELERWLRHEPIRARPASNWERALKWTRRHRAQAALLATIAFAGFALTVLSLVFNVRLERARQFAERTAARQHEQLARELSREAGRAAAAGDAFTGLFPLTEALRLEAGHSNHTEALRRRIGLTLRSAPTLLRLGEVGGHPQALAFTPDNRRLTVALHDGRIRTWNLADGTTTDIRRSEATNGVSTIFAPNGEWAGVTLAAPPFAQLIRLTDGHTVSLDLPSACQTMAFAHQGRWFVTGGDRLRVWDLATLREIPPAAPRPGPCARLVISPDDQWLLVLGPDGKGRIFETQNWHERDWPRLSSEPAQPLPCFSADGRWLLLFKETELSLVNTSNGVPDLTVAHAGLNFRPTCSPDGRYIAVPGFRTQARIWSLPPPGSENRVNPYRLPIRHETGANQIVFSPDGRLLATAGFDYQLRLINTDNHQLVAPLLRHAALVEAVAFSADARFLASVDARGLLRVWDLQLRGITTLPRVAAKPTPQYLPDSRRLVARDTRDRLSVWDTTAGVPEGEPLYVPPEALANTTAHEEEWPQANLGAPMDLAWDDSHRFLAAAVGVQGARVWEFPARHLVAAWTNIGTVLSVVFEPGGSVLAMGNSAGEVRRSEVISGRSLGVLSASIGPIKALSSSPGQPWLAAASEQAVQVWNTADQQPLAAPFPLADFYSALQFSPGGQHLLVAAGNYSIAPGAAQLWKPPTLRPAFPPLEHGDGVAAAAFSPDNRWIGTGGEDNVVRLWNASTGGAVGQAMRHEGIVNTLNFAPQSRWLAAGGNDGRLRVWSVPGGELAGPPLPLASSVPTVLFSPDGQSVFVGSHRQNSWVVRFDPDVTPIEEVERLARAQTVLRSTADGALELAPPADLAREFAPHWPSGDCFESSAEAVHWHESLATPAEARGAWFTAVFHLRRWSALRPNETDLPQRLERAVAASRTPVR